MIDHNNILGKDIDVDDNIKSVFFVSSLIMYTIAETITKPY